MEHVLDILIGAFLAGTALVLAWGLFAMIRSGGNDPARSNRLMRLRVLLQGLALLLLALFFLVTRR